jgi:tetratricopeptide (TPR) repeat protein
MAPSLVFAARKARLVGRLIDVDKNPVEGVAVTVTSPDIPDMRVSKVTDKRGIFIVDYTRIDVTYVYRFEKTGFQTLEVSQLWSLEGTQNSEWTLPPATAQLAEGVKPASTSVPAVDSYNEGAAAFKAKAFEAAEAKFKEAVAYDPNLQQAWTALAVVQMEMGLDKQAAESAEKAIALGATDEATLTARWQAYTNLKDEEKAAQALKDLETAGRRTEEAKRIHNEAIALAKAGNNEAAFTKFQQALNLDPNLQESQIGLATVALKLGRNAEAATAAEAVLKTDPKNQKALRLRYNACLTLGDKERLASALTGLAAIEPTVARDGLLALGFEAYDAGDMAKSREWFSKAVAIDANQPLAQLYLGIACANLGANEEAIAHLEAFLKLSPDNAEAASAREMLKILGKPQ